MLSSKSCSASVGIPRYQAHEGHISLFWHSPHNNFKVAEIFSCGSSNPAKAVLRGRAGGAPDNLVIYPPRCIPHRLIWWRWWFGGGCDGRCDNFVTFHSGSLIMVFNVGVGGFVPFHIMIIYHISLSLWLIVSSNPAALSPSMDFPCSPLPSAMFMRFIRINFNFWYLKCWFFKICHT